MADRRLPAWTLVCAVVVALVAAVVAYRALDGGEAAMGDDGEEVPRPAGELGSIDLRDATFQTLNGRTRELAELRGTPLVVNFFASWCTPCRAEMPALQAVADDLRGEVRFLGLAVQDRPQDTLRFVEELGVTYDVGRDVDSAIGVETGAIVRLPGTVLLDSDGTVVARHIGQLDEDELREMLHEELGVG